jgi:hypothetical protein
VSRLTTSPSFLRLLNLLLLYLRLVPFPRWYHVTARSSCLCSKLKYGEGTRQTGKRRREMQVRMRSWFHSMKGVQPHPIPSRVDRHPLVWLGSRVNWFQFVPRWNECYETACRMRIGWNQNSWRSQTSSYIRNREIPILYFNFCYIASNKVLGDSKFSTAVKMSMLVFRVVTPCCR